MKHEHEQAILTAFRAMDDARQQEMLGFMEDVANEFPREPRLRLVHSAGVTLPLLPASKEAG
jgi:hypothetical protein